jgi:hypothetical protein
MPQNQEYKQEIKGERRHSAHINGGNCLRVVLQKGLPGLRRRVPASHHVFRDRRLRDFEPKHQQLAMDPGCAPKWVFPAHPPDQISQATINPRPPCPLTRFQTPKHFEASAMPTQDGLRLDDLHRTKKARPKPRHPDEQHAITATQSETRWCPPQSYAELMAEKQVLGFKPAARLEQAATNIPSACRIANIARNAAMILPYDANPGRMKFSKRTGVALVYLTLVEKSDLVATRSPQDPFRPVGDEALSLCGGCLPIWSSEMNFRMAAIISSLVGSGAAVSPVTGAWVCSVPVRGCSQTSSSFACF